MTNQIEEVKDEIVNVLKKHDVKPTKVKNTGKEA